MTPEMEMYPPAVGISGTEGDATTTQSRNNTRKSSTSNGDLGQGQGHYGGRIGHQGCGG